MQEHFRPKGIKELDKQVQDAKEQVGTDIIPPSLSSETVAILHMHEGELRAKFPKRFEMYQRLFGASKRDWGG